MTSWLVRFTLICLGSIAGVVLLLWAVNGFGDLGLDWQGALALVLGIVLTSGLGVGLMAASFYSDRSRRDDGDEARKRFQPR